MRGGPVSEKQNRPGATPERRRHQPVRQHTLTIDHAGTRVIEVLPEEPIACDDSGEERFERSGDAAPDSNVISFMS